MITTPCAGLPKRDDIGERVPSGHEYFAGEEFHVSRSHANRKGGRLWIWHRWGRAWYLLRDLPGVDNQEVVAMLGSRAHARLLRALLLRFHR